MSDKNICLKVKVPAKIMLSGEYAVMSGYSSVSLALDKYITIELKQAPGPSSEVVSSLWKEPYVFESLEPLKDSSDILLQSLYSVLQSKKIPPFHFRIENDFCVSSGFGSSSALRLGVQYAFHLFLKALEKGERKVDSLESWDLARNAFHEQKAYQKKASGYDFITQKEGGALLYRPGKKLWPEDWWKLDPCGKKLKKYLHIFIGGKGASTKEVMNKTDAWLSRNQLKDRFYDLSENLSSTLTSFFEGKKEGLWQELVTLISHHRDFMKHSPFFPRALEETLKKLEGFDKTWTFKTTGSGGEDALLFFGSDENLKKPKEVLATLGWREDSWNLDEKGIHYNLEAFRERRACESL